MTDKEKLIQILNVPIFPHVDADPLEAVADYLLDNDVRPVRTCKNCKFYMPFSGYCCYFEDNVKDDFYCSWAEEKEDV